MLLFGALAGWKRGGITSIIYLIGTIIIFVSAFYLKNPVSRILYENMPFFKFAGIFRGLSSLNILIYEATAYIIVVLVLAIILGIILKVSKILDKLVNLTIILTLPNKLIGLVVGVVQYYIAIYFICFVLLQVPVVSIQLRYSDIVKTMMHQTPILSEVTNEMYNTYNDVYNICYLYEDSYQREEADYKILEILMSHDIIESKSVVTLKDQGKLNISDVSELIKKYSK
jgi:hypothetical protein